MLFGFVRGCVGLRPGATARGRITNQLSNPGLTYHSRVFVTCRATGSNVWFHAFGRCCQESYATQPTPSAKSRTPTGLWVEPFRITATLLRNRIFSAQLRVDTKLSRFVYTPAYRSLARFLLSSNLPTALTTRCSPVAWSISPAAAGSGSEARGWCRSPRKRSSSSRGSRWRLSLRCCSR
jgi:hypothetical protein